MIITKITNSIVWDHRGRVPDGGKGQLEIRVTIARKSYYFGTGIKCRKSEFVAGQIINCPGAQQLNNRLAIIYNKVLACVNACIEDGSQIDTESIRRMVWQTSESLNEEPTFINWIESQVPMLNLADGTRKHYHTLIVRLIEFDKMNRWQDVTVENIYLFDSWLHQLKTYDGRRISDGGVFTYHKCLKALLNRARGFGKIAENPYINLRGKFRRGDKENVEYLTEDEMRAFELLLVPDGSLLAMAKDLFVFQMYTGLSFSDAQAFDISDYKWDGQRWNHVGERIKTGVPYVSSLLPPALNVLQKYGMKVPKLDNADYNHQLKALGVMAGIKTRLHSHLARHTFATYMLRNGVKIENVSRMLGHTNITQTQRYAKVIAQSVHDDFDMIAEKLKKDKGR
jgi:integrase